MCVLPRDGSELNMLEPTFGFFFILRDIAFFLWVHGSYRYMRLYGTEGGGEGRGVIRGIPDKKPPHKAISIPPCLSKIWNKGEFLISYTRNSRSVRGNTVLKFSWYTFPSLFVQNLEQGGLLTGIPPDSFELHFRSGILTVLYELILLQHGEKFDSSHWSCATTEGNQREILLENSVVSLKRKWSTVLRFWPGPQLVHILFLLKCKLIKTAENGSEALYLSELRAKCAPRTFKAT